MPRPRRFYEAWPRRRIVEAYKGGVAPRILARRSGLSRWAIEETLTRAGVARREPERAAAVGSWVRAEEREHERAARCTWPDCAASRNGSGALCGKHHDHLDALEGERRCLWPLGPMRTCGQATHGGALCYRHAKAAAGLSG